MDRCRVFAPASVANLGPGFDILGVAVEGIGDTVTAARVDTGVRISRIRGDDSLSLDAKHNTASLAASEVLALIEQSGGMELELDKGVPGGSGLGSSAASAAAGAFAANLLYDGGLSALGLLTAATRAEAHVSGAFFADNTAPSLLGGAQLIRSYDPFGISPLGTIPKAELILVTPAISILTRDARAALDPSITLEQHVEHTARACTIVGALLQSDYRAFVESMRDEIVEPSRARRIPNYDAAREAALTAGADAFTIAGSGPTVLAIVSDAEKAAKIGAAIQSVFASAGLDAAVRCTRMAESGARALRLD